MDIIINKNSLSISKLRRDAFDVIEAGYKAIEIEPFVRNNLNFSNDIISVEVDGKIKKFDVKNSKRVFVFGLGKGSYTAVSAIADILGKKLSQAYALDIEDSPKPTKVNSKVEVFYGTHPKSSLKNVSATKKIIKIIKDTDKDDFIIYFIAGGGSSLLCGSDNEHKCNSEFFNILTKKGAPIEDLNIVRKHTSTIKGGWLAYHTYPAKSLSLIVSDVCGNDISTVASGPTVFDKTTIKDAEKILKKYKIPTTALQLKETPKDKKYFLKARSLLFASNKNALLQMEEKARLLGYGVKIVSTLYSGEAKYALSKLVKKVKKGSILLAGGETTVTIGKKMGKGGRNQEAVLGVLANAYDVKINLSNIFASSIASDGYDNGPVAGAFADSNVLATILDKNIDIDKYLEDHNSFVFFKKVGAFLEVRRHSFNVSDLMIVVSEV